jgi:hypothetical protein
MSNPKFIKKFLLTAMIGVVYLLHQDFWNWKRAEPLLFGFLPVGLAYHAGFSILAAIMMGVLVKFAWPRDLEDVTPRNVDPKQRANGGPS